RLKPELPRSPRVPSERGGGGLRTPRAGLGEGGAPAEPPVTKTARREPRPPKKTPPRSGGRGVPTQSVGTRACRGLSVLFLILHPSLFILPASAQPRFYEPKEGYYQARRTQVSAPWAVDR